jgi:hypothetical protein
MRTWIGVFLIVVGLAGCKHDTGRWVTECTCADGRTTHRVDEIPTPMDWCAAWCSQEAV